MIFLDQIYPKSVILLGNGKSQHHHWILYTWISLGAKFQLNLTLLNFWTKLLIKYAVYIFGICCISFTNSGTNIFTENPKTLEILPFYWLHTKAWPKIRKLWVNPKKYERRKKTIPIRFTKVNLVRGKENNMFRKIKILFTTTECLHCWFH